MLILAGIGAVELGPGIARGHVDTSESNYRNLRQRGAVEKRKTSLSRWKLHSKEAGLANKFCVFSRLPSSDATVCQPAF